MDKIFIIVAIALVATIFSALIKKEAPHFAIILSSIAGVYILTISMGYVADILANIREFISMSGISQTIFIPVIKAILAAVIIRIVCETCKDAGENGLAAKLEVAGVSFGILLIFPLFQSVIDLISSLIMWA